MMRPALLGLAALCMALWLAPVFLVAPVAGAAVEGYLSPVIGAQAVSSISRTADLACWRWDFVKRRRGIGRHGIQTDLVEADLKLTVDGDLVDTAALVRRPDGSLRYIRAMRSSPGDDQWRHRDLCADLWRSDIASSARIAVGMTMRYRSALVIVWPKWTGWGRSTLRSPWITPVAVKRFDVPPLL